jgi:hypothetical protein
MTELDVARIRAHFDFRGLFESAYDTIAAWINAPSRRCLVICRNTTGRWSAVWPASTPTATSTWSTWRPWRDTPLG